ncbi:FimB/Mfa2 family fimbrial subunit [Bacteroides sp. GM023]|uniref:FimB/Mfa2 family fimbrial subunit n=1 Tax=Bacteroides sp. GM023 TaxID=2723058 RepID=UPI00168AE027|nr:FimB/Mfa2 family fimbrial subunit [Bacteroides sp. GM023]MBD3591383.1 FimB/Mfa2 family fimbrial subunit [Bacteroides sp. GM023]
MKGILTTIQKKASKALLLTILASAIASCDSVLGYDDGDCSIKYRVKFKYDYNMDEVDAFAKQVRTVTLYAFDDKNNLVYQKTDEGEMLGNEIYAMDLDIDPTQYHLIAWAGLNDESFAIPVLFPEQSKLEELKVKTLRREAAQVRTSPEEEEKGKYLVEQSLHSLWHGEVKQNATNTRSVTTINGREQITTVNLVKNTNSIRIIIAQKNESGGPVTRALTKKSFGCVIYDDNGYMNYDNSLLDDNLLTYKPIVINEENVKSRAFSAEGEGAKEYPAIVSELNVGRLIKDKTPQLVIKNTITNETLFKCDNLVTYFELLQLEKYKDRNYTLQEYLDREDNYGIIVFVDENLALINTVIDVNDWIIHLNEIEL